MKSIQPIGIHTIKYTTSNFNVFCEEEQIRKNHK